jgi:hypothetical protein
MPPTLKARFSLAQLLMLTAAVAVSCVVLMNENEWLRAAYVTASLGILLNALIAAVFSRGERQAFFIGFLVGAVFCGTAGLYSAGFTLPYLLSVELHKWLKQSVSHPPSDMHFATVMGISWIMASAVASGCLACRWRAVRPGGPPPPDAGEGGSEKQQSMNR